MVSNNLTKNFHPVPLSSAVIVKQDFGKNRF